MRVLLADDETRVRFAMRVLLLHQPGIELAGEVAKAADLPQALAEACPDVLLLDWELRGSSGARMVQAARSICPGLPIVALSGKPDACRAALSAGANVFVSKADPPDRLLAALMACCGTPTFGPGRAYAAC